MLPSLQKLLDTLPNQLISPKINQTIKTNVFDGKHMEKKMKRKNTLAFALFVDDMELVNVCDAGTKVHKQSSLVYS